MTTYTTAVHGLATDIRLPDGPGPFPAVLVRTPYDRRAHHAELRGWARRGFAAVAQDVRGRHGSAGEWRPYTHEAADGADTARWIRRQPWSDGRLVASGASYAAHCAVTLALDAPEDARPDAVIAAVPALGAADTAREPSGVERLLTRAGWWAAHGDRPDSDHDALDKALAADPDALTHLPLLHLPRRLGRELPSWPELWRHHDRGRLIARAARARMPLLAVGGHHDHFAEDTVELWRHWGGPCPRLLMGPWGHGLIAAPGPDAHPSHRVRLGDLYARWADSALAGHLTGGRAGALALGGSHLWTAADSEGEPYAPRLRPLHGTAFTARPERPVSSVELTVPADGEPDRCVLVTAPLPRPLDLLGPARVRLRARAATPSADWFARLVALAPERPAGIPAGMPAGGPAGGLSERSAGDQARGLAAGPAGRPAEGSAEGSPEGPGGDRAQGPIGGLAAGQAERLAVGAVRRHGQPPGETAEFTIPLGRIARRLPAGTRLRLEIAGHHFPAHARNPHTGEDAITATRLTPSAREVDPARLELRLSVLRTRPTPTDPAEEILR